MQWNKNPLICGHPPGHSQFCNDGWHSAMAVAQGRGSCSPQSLGSIFWVCIQDRLNKRESVTLALDQQPLGSYSCDLQWANPAPLPVHAQPMQATLLVARCGTAPISCGPHAYRGKGKQHRGFLLFLWDPEPSLSPQTCCYVPPVTGQEPCAALQPSCARGPPVPSRLKSSLLSPRWMLGARCHHRCKGLMAMKGGT